MDGDGNAVPQADFGAGDGVDLLAQYWTFGQERSGVGEDDRCLLLRGGKHEYKSVLACRQAVAHEHGQEYRHGCGHLALAAPSADNGPEFADPLGRRVTTASNCGK